VRLTKWILLLYVGLVASLPTCYLQQIIDVPALLEHYQHHVFEHEKVSFLDFLIVHYTEQYHHEDGNNHKENPLSNTSNTNSSTLVYGFIPHTLVMNLDGIHISFENIKIPAIAHQNSTSDFFLSIWKPPKSSTNSLS